MSAVKHELEELSEKMGFGGEINDFVTDVHKLGCFYDLKEGHWYMVSPMIDEPQLKGKLVMFWGWQRTAGVVFAVVRMPDMDIASEWLVQPSMLIKKK